MTVKTEGGVPASPATLASSKGPVRAGTVEQLGRADRVARGKDARAVTPLESHAEFQPAGSRDPLGLLLEQAKSRVPELVPVRHGQMLVSPFTFYRGAALPMAADLATTPPRGCGCSCAATRTCPISASSPRRSGGWSSTSMISMRLCPARSNGTSSARPRAWRWRAGTIGSPPGRAARSSSRRPKRLTGGTCWSSSRSSRRPARSSGSAVRHLRPDLAHAQRRRSRTAVPASQGGPAVGSGGLLRAQPVHQPGRAGRRRAAPDAGRKRHLPRLDPCARTGQGGATFASASSRTGSSPP